jgi:hypothetical protein
MHYSVSDRQLAIAVTVRRTVPTIDVRDFRQRIADARNRP